MQNAHLRLGLLEYHRMTEKTSTRIRLRLTVTWGGRTGAPHQRLRQRFRRRRDHGSCSREGHVHADFPGR